MAIGRSVGWLVLAGVLVTTAIGCALIDAAGSARAPATDAALIDGTAGGDGPGTAADAGPPDAGPPDARPPDARPVDARPDGHVDALNVDGL